MSKEEISNLVEARHKIGLYSVNELATMFGVGRGSIDLLLNTGQLKFISPNNKIRYIQLKDYLYFIEKKEAIGQVCDKDNGSDCKSAY